MIFLNRKDAGKKLAKKLKKYALKQTIVYGLPRGGVIVASEIARALNLKIDVLMIRKIGHPAYLEYAIGAVNDKGQIFGDKDELYLIPRHQLNAIIKREIKTIRSRQKLYFKA